MVTQRKKTGLSTPIDAKTKIDHLNYAEGDQVTLESLEKKLPKIALPRQGPSAAPGALLVK